MLPIAFVMKYGMQFHKRKASGIEKKREKQMKNEKKRNATIDARH